LIISIVGLHSVAQPYENIVFLKVVSPEIVYAVSFRGAIAPRVLLVSIRIQDAVSSHLANHRTGSFPR